MKVLVTGATGRLGMNLVQALEERGYDTISFAFDTPAEKHLRRNLKKLGTKIVLGDLATGAGLAKAVRDADACIHAAALMQEDKVSREMFFDINTRGAFLLMEALRAKAKKPRRVVAITTGAVYDALTAKAPYRESDTLRPLSLYGMSKVLNEHIYRLTWFQTGIPVITLRPNYILAGLEPLEVWSGGVLLEVMKAWCRDKRTTLYTKARAPWKPLARVVGKNPQALVVPYGPGGKSWRWHVTDVRDVVAACINALETKNEKAFGQVFNVASAKPQDFSDVVPYLAKKLAQPYTEVKLPVVWDISFDISRTRRILGYRPKYDYKRMINDAIRLRDGQNTGVIPPGIPH